MTAAAGENPSVIVYSKPGCPGCNLTKMHLENRHISFDVQPLETLPRAIDTTDMLHAPVVVAGEQVWDGYRPDRIDALKKAAVAA